MNDNRSFYDTHPVNEEPVNEQAAVTQPVTTHPEENQDVQGQMITRETVEDRPFHWLKEEEKGELKSRWNTIQTTFIDGPRSSVEQADALVADAIERIQKVLTNQRSQLDQRWMKDGELSTEDMRTLLQDYRTFFNRLLEI